MTPHGNPRQVLTIPSPAVVKRLLLLWVTVLLAVNAYGVTFSPFTFGPPRHAFDARELTRFGSMERGAMVGSEVLFMEPSAWARYRYYLLGTLLVLMLVESGLVALLLAERRRGNRSRQMLERRFAIERVISECSTTLSECAGEKVDAEIENSLQALLAAEGADRTSWFVI